VGINVFLNSSSVDRLYQDSSISQYGAIGDFLKAKLAGPLAAGQKIEEIRNIKQILLNTKESLKQVDLEQTALANIFTITRYRAVLANLKNRLINLLNSDQKIVGINDSEQLQPDINQTLHSNDKEVKTFSGTPISGYAVSLALPNNIIVSSTNQDYINRRLPEKTLAELKSGKDKKKVASDFHHIKHFGLYYLTFPIQDENQTLLALIALTIPADRLQANKHILILDNIVPLVSIFFGGIFILLVALNHMAKNRPDGTFYSKTKISFVVFAVICSAQISFSGVTTVAFKDLYLKMNREKARMNVGLFKDHVESFLNEGKYVEDLNDGEVALAEIISRYPELNDIILFDRKWHPLYIVTQNNALNCQTATYGQINEIKKSLPEWDPEFNVRLNITQNDHIQGYVSTDISKSLLYSRLIDISLDSLTVLVISILFLVEMMILIFNFVKNEPVKQQSQPIIRSKDDPKVHYGLMRPAAFMLLFGYDISMSFLPLHTEKLYAPLFGLSKDVIMGLPISVELFFVGISILFAGIWLDRRGWHEPFLTGLFLSGVGILYSWAAPDVLHFIISRGITGSGYGLALMASQGFVIEYTDNRSKAQGLAYLFAGIYAGSLCGGATGAMLADRFDYSSVFFAGSVIIFSVIIYCFIFMRKGMLRPQTSAPVQHTNSAPMGKVTGFLSNRIVLSLIFFSSLPAAIAVVGFLNYFSPIYLNRLGASQSTIGRILMIYGICLIYIGPIISRYVDASNKKRLYIFMGCLLGSMAFLTFNVIDGLMAAAIAVLLLGLSSSFVLASQSAYTLRLKVTEELGAGKSIGIFRSTSRGGQVLGPIVFSWLILATNIQDGITYFGLAYLGFAVIFLLLTMRDKKQLSF
jgi:predicted MFS family arabinose efflux permease